MGIQCGDRYGMPPLFVRCCQRRLLRRLRVKPETEWRLRAVSTPFYKLVRMCLQGTRHAPVAPVEYLSEVQRAFQVSHICCGYDSWSTAPKTATSRNVTAGTNQTYAFRTFRKPTSHPTSSLLQLCARNTALPVGVVERPVAKHGVEISGKTVDRF